MYPQDSIAVRTAKGMSLMRRAFYKPRRPRKAKSQIKIVDNVQLVIGKLMQLKKLQKNRRNAKPQRQMKKAPNLPQENLANEEGAKGSW